MIKLFFIVGMAIFSCGPTKPSQSVETTDSSKVTVTTEEAAKETVPSGESTIDTKPGNDIAGLPVCIKNKIDSFKVLQKHEQPQRVIEYQYKGKKVYYIVMPCCDFYNEVYDTNCKFLGAPDGGFTGKGDGKLPDFKTEATKEKLIWEAK